jgi:hypothetical protein
MATAAQRSDEQDSSWKDALDLFLPYFLLFLFPEIHEAIDWTRGYTALDKEFQQIIREAKVGKGLADKLYQVWLKSGQVVWLLIHIEIQGRVEKKFPERMFRYNVRAYLTYNQQVISLAVLTDQRPNWRPDRFEYGAFGCKTSVEFKRAKLLDYRDRKEELFRSANPFAQVVLAHLQAQETKSDPRSRRAQKVRLVKGLYERGWSADQVRQLFRLIDWMMALPPEWDDEFRTEIYQFEEERHMPYLSSIERLAIEKGKRIGQREGLRRAIELDLEEKFGADGLKLLPRIEKLNDVAKLEALKRALITLSDLKDVRRLVVDLLAQDAS